MFEDQEKTHANKLAICGLNTIEFWSLRLICVAVSDQGFI